MRHSRLPLAALLLSACALGSVDSAPVPVDKENLLRTTLPNGLKVVLLEDHASPVVALNVWVRVGSADELEEEAGMAHVFEHMLFKGTERRAVGEIAATVEAAGGNINAFTSFDMTVYHITMASRDVDVGIDVLADAVLNSTFDPTELARESEVVLEEIRRSQDSPGRALTQAVFDTSFTTHPYRLPVIGTEESVKSFSREHLLDFYARWYVPGNMTFIVVGDIDPDAALAQIESAFADVATRAVAHPRASEPEQTEPRAQVVRTEFEQNLLGLAFPITSFRHEDTPDLDLLSLVLGGGESSRLYRGVKDQLQLVHGIGAGSYTPKDAGLFTIDARLDSDRIEDAVSAIATEVRRLRDFGPSDAELERARVNILSDEVHEKQTMQGQARKLGYFETLADGLEAEAVYLERIRRARPDDLQRAARRYLAPERVTVVAALAAGERDDLDAAALLAAYAGGEGSDRGRPVGEQVSPGVWRYQLPNGLRVIVKPNPSIPLVALRLSLLGGLLAETDATQGITSFAADVLTRGTEQRSAAQIAAEVESIGGSLFGFSGRNSFGLVGEFLADSLDTGLDLFADVLLHPAFDPDEIEKERSERMAALLRREDSSQTKAFELFQNEIFPGHPYRFPTIGNAASLEKLDRQALVNYFATYAWPSNGVLSVVGDVEPERIVAALTSYLGDWSGPESVALPERTLPPRPSEPREVSLEKNRNQVHIIVGFPGLALDDPDLPALEVLTQILSGQGGRLFLDLRDRQSLAYSVSAFSIEGLDPGTWGVYIASAPEKLDAARDGLRAQLAKVLDEPIAPEELDRARAYLIGSHAVSRQAFGAQAAVLSLDELYGFGPEWDLGFADRIAAVTPRDVERVARRIIDLDDAVVVVVR